MRRFVLPLLIVCAIIALAPALVSHAAPNAKALRVAFVGPLTGEAAASCEEYIAGAKDAVAAADGPKLEIVTVDSVDRSPKELLSDIRRAKANAIVGAPDGDSAKTLATIARTAKLPLVLVTPWEPRFSLDAKDPVTHLSASQVDHAVAAGNYAMIPLEAKKVAVLHDGSDPSRALADAFVRNRPIPVEDGGVHAAPSSAAEMKQLAADLKKEQVELLFVATGHEAATIVAKGSTKDGPALLFADGLASEALVALAPETARFLRGVHPYFEDGALMSYRNNGTPKASLRERGFEATRLIADAMAIAGSARKLAESMRRVTNPRAVDSPVLSDWGAPREYVYYIVQKTSSGTARTNPLTLPDVGGGNLLRYRETSYYSIDPETHMVLLTFGEGEERTIEKDLQNLGLSSKGYEADMDAWVQDEIFARAIAYLHKVFMRNSDGTPIPGVSFNVTFGTELPKDVKPHQVWTVTIAGDDPSAWGRAIPPNRAFAYASKLANEIYKKYELDPALSTSDTKYFRYRYQWNSSLNENLRHDSIRALVDGYASAVAMVTAHELGHLAGCSHDRESPRSLMNVVDGGGISPLWAEWIPSHLKKLDRSIKRVKGERP